jgi:hypothetical protein
LLCGPCAWQGGSIAAAVLEAKYYEYEFKVSSQLDAMTRRDPGALAVPVLAGNGAYAADVLIPSEALAGRNGWTLLVELR